MIFGLFSGHGIFCTIDGRKVQKEYHTSPRGADIPQCVVFTASGGGRFTMLPIETLVGTPMRRSQWSVYIYSQWSVYSIYILGLPCAVRLSVGDLARAPDVAGARCPLTPRPPSVASFRCPLQPRVEVTLARCRAAAHRRAVYARGRSA